MDNDFYTIKFNFNQGYPHKLEVSVYKSKKSLESNDMLFSFIYEQADGEIGANDISRADKMKLEIYE